MPSLGIMPLNSLAAADSVIIPSQPSFLSAKGLDLLMHSISQVKRQINPKLKIDGILFTMVDSRTNEAKEIIASLRAHYGEKIRVFGRHHRDALHRPQNLTDDEATIIMVDSKLQRETIYRPKKARFAL